LTQPEKRVKELVAENKRLKAEVERLKELARPCWPCDEGDAI